MDGPIIQTVVGLVFIFAVFAGLTTMATEAIARYMGLRGEYLLRGIRSLVDGKSDFELAWWKNLWRTKAAVDERKQAAQADHTPAAVPEIMSHPVISASAAGANPPAEAGDTQLTREDLTTLPSYVSSRAFATAVLDLVIPNSDDKDDQGRSVRFADIEAKLNSLPFENFKKKLLPLVRQSEGKVEELRTSLEQLYDDHMARVSGWYKRHVRWITLGLAAVLAVVLNLNAVEIARTLYGDEGVRAAVVAQAEAAAEAGCKEGEDACFSDVQKAVREAQSAGLPIGWSTVEVCTLEEADCGFFEERGIVPLGGNAWDTIWTIALLLLGWALMAAAAVPGARFWIDSLSKLGSLRSTGPKPASSTTG